MPRKATFFCFTTKTKACNACLSVLPLSQFSPSSDYMVGPEMASHYRHICKKCNCERAKKSQARRKINTSPTVILKKKAA